jgi:hypothetical protein
LTMPSSHWRPIWQLLQAHPPGTLGKRLADFESGVVANLRRLHDEGECDQRCPACRYSEYLDGISQDGKCDR